MSLDMQHGTQKRIHIGGLRDALAEGGAKAVSRAVRGSQIDGLLCAAGLPAQRKSASGAIGTTVKLDGVPYTVIGVLPPGFHCDGRAADVYTPIALSPNTREWLSVDVYARLRPGVTVMQANAEMDAIANAMRHDDPFEWRPRVWKLHDFQVREVRLSLLILLGAVGLVVLIACANTASLLLARANARGQEIAVREALGAGRPRLLRQLLTESTLLALLGGAFGVAVAAICVRLVPYLQHEKLPGLLEQTRVDGTVLAFTLGISVLTGIVFGAAPALIMTRGNPHSALKSGGRGGAKNRQRAFQTLIAGETALAVLLAVGATLLIRTFFYLRDVRLDFASTVW